MIVLFLISNVLSLRQINNRSVFLICDNLLFLIKDIDFSLMFEDFLGLLS